MLHRGCIEASSVLVHGASNAFQVRRVCTHRWYDSLLMDVSSGERVCALQLMGDSTDYTVDVAPGVDWTAVCAMLMVQKAVRPALHVPPPACFPSPS